MGFRSHFVLRDAGGADLRASHWGGARLLRDLLHGPELFEAYVRSRRSCEELHYRDSVDAVVLLDLEPRRLSFWGGDNLGIEFIPGLRHHYLALLAARWPGWTIEWMPHGAHDLAAKLGLSPPAEIPPELQVRALLGDHRCEDPVWRTAITQLDPHGPPRDGRSGWTLEQLLTLGPALLETQATIEWGALPAETAELPAGHEDGDPHGGLIIDPAHRHLECWWNEPSASHHVAAKLLARFWPGWTVQVQTEGLRLHMRRSGRDPELVALPIEPAARALEQRLFGDVEEHDFAKDAREELRALLASVQGDGPTEVSYGAGVFTDDAGLPVPEGVRGQVEALLRQSDAC